MKKVKIATDDDVSLFSVSSLPNLSKEYQKLLSERKTVLYYL